MTQREHDEREAVKLYACPICKRVAGAKCVRQGYQTTDFPRPEILHPHEARVQLHIADSRDQGRADW